jgi:hypothetical protein
MGEPYEETHRTLTSNACWRTDPTYPFQTLEQISPKALNFTKSVTGPGGVQHYELVTSNSLGFVESEVLDLVNWTSGYNPYLYIPINVIWSQHTNMDTLPVGDLDTIRKAVNNVMDRVFKRLAARWKIQRAVAPPEDVVAYLKHFWDEFIHKVFMPLYNNETGPPKQLNEREVRFYADYGAHGYSVAMWPWLHSMHRDIRLQTACKPTKALIRIWAFTPVILIALRLLRVPEMEGSGEVVMERIASLLITSGVWKHNDRTDTKRVTDTFATYGAALEVMFRAAEDYNTLPSNSNKVFLDATLNLMKNAIVTLFKLWRGGCYKGPFETNIAKGKDNHWAHYTQITEQMMCSSATSEPYLLPYWLAQHIQNAYNENHQGRPYQITLMTGRELPAPLV